MCTRSTYQLRLGTLESMYPLMLRIGALFCTEVARGAEDIVCQRGDTETAT